jgi:eukaryotic-like serine/threonine-protein kinase
MLWNKILTTVAVVATISGSIDPVLAAPKPAGSTPQISIISFHPPVLVVEAASAWIKVPGGLTRVGYDNGYACEAPEHLTWVAEFWIQPHEVTSSAYGDCVAAGACALPGTGPGCNWGDPSRLNHPVNCVSYYDSLHYCAFAQGDLPTEQEWERAARYPDDRLYPWTGAIPTLCWDGSSTCPATAHPAGATSLGVQGFSDNVAEWTASPYVSYMGDATSTRRAVRGGWFSLSNQEMLRLTYRKGVAKGVRGAHIGFRCVRRPDRAGSDSTPTG